MRFKLTTNLYGLILVTLFSSLTIAAQNMRVDVSKRAARIPKVCVDVVPASIDGKIDVPGLVKEAICKGAGDMLIEYTYSMKVNSREQDKKGNTKEETTTYEVFIPTLKSGMHTKGILLVTNRNGVAVPPDELEKERLKTGERLEKEENKIASAEAPQPPTDAEERKGMLPIGMYIHSSLNRAAFGMRRGGATLAIDDFLETCDFKLLRREQMDGHGVLVFRFTPQPEAQFSPNGKYIAQLTGEIWIDATERIVTRLVGWPRDEKDLKANGSVTSSTDRRPAVFVEMMRLNDGTWLPRVVQINGSDYPALFDHIPTDTTWNYSNYIHFSTEIKDFKVRSPDKP